MLTQNIDIIDDLNAIIRANINKKIIAFFQTVKISQLYADAFEKTEIVVELDDMEGSIRETAVKEGVKQITAKVMRFNGKMNQETRSAIFTEFLERKSGLLFTTNIAARGLGIP
jgi:superfamily II DNA/RNA helicase